MQKTLDKNKVKNFVIKTYAEFYSPKHCVFVDSGIFQFNFRPTVFFINLGDRNKLEERCSSWCSGWLDCSVNDQSVETIIKDVEICCMFRSESQQMSRKMSWPVS